MEDNKKMLSEEDLNMVGGGEDIPWSERIVTINCKRCGASINVTNFQKENGYSCPACGQWVNTKIWNNEV